MQYVINPHCIVAMQDSVPVSSPWYMHILLPAQKKKQGIFHLCLLSILQLYEGGLLVANPPSYCEV